MDLQDALNIAGNVADRSDDELAEAIETITNAAQELAGNPTAENLAQLRQVTEAAEAMDSALLERETARQAAEAEASELLARLPGLRNQADPETPAEDDDADGPDAPEDTADAPEVVDAPAPELVPAAAAVEGAGTAATRVTNQRSRAGQGLLAAQRRAARPAAVRPAEPEAAPIVASAGLHGFNQGDRMLPEHWGRFADGVIASAMHNRPAPGRMWSAEQEEAAEFAQYGGGRKVSLARVPVRFGVEAGTETPVVSTDPRANEATLDRVARDTKAQFRQALSPSIAAAGGCPCAPYPVDYDLFNLVEPYNPIESDIPAVSMPRGGIRYMECLDWTVYAAGTEVRDCADENTAIGSYVAKPCVRITCPTERSTAPIIIPACLTVGNFISQTYPELVRQALEWLTIHYEDLKQVAYQDAIRAAGIAGTNYTQAAVYGAVRTYLSGLRRATAMYRARRHMRPDSPLQVFVPYWLPWVLVNDVLNQGQGGLGEYMAIDDAEAFFRAELRKMNVVPSFFYLKPTSVLAAQWIDRAQTDAAALNAWPTTAETIITAPGVWNRGQIADIDFGLVVDSPLIRTNDAMFFMETMVSIFDRCSTATELLTTTLCPNGDAAGVSTPFTCS